MQYGILWSSDTCSASTRVILSDVTGWSHEAGLGRICTLHLTYQRWVSEISDLEQPANTFRMSHPNELREEPYSISHVLQGEQADLTILGPRVISRSW